MGLILTVIKAGTAKIKNGESHPLLGAYTAELISDAGNLTQFGALIETLPKGSKSSLLHWHANEDEMILMLSGQVTLHQGGEKTKLTQGDAACFKAGDPVGHCLENTSDQDASYLLIGTRTSEDTVTYPGRNRKLLRNNDQRVWTDENGNAASSVYDDEI